MEYEYTDTCVYDVTNGDELTTKKGFDKYNNWNCRNYRNKIKDFSHVENIASNKKDKMEWKEKWDEEKNIYKVLCIVLSRLLVMKKAPEL